MYKNKFRLFFTSIILLSTIIIAIVIGYSLWVIGERKDIIPTYNFEDLFENNIKLEEVYSASEFDIKNSADVVFNIDWDSFNIHYLDENKINLSSHNNHPYNAGKYFVKIESKTLHAENGIDLRSAYVELNILKATPKIDSSKEFLIKNDINEYITTSSDINDLSVTDSSGKIFHDESSNDSPINGTIEITNSKNLNVGNNSIKCLFKPIDTTNFNNLEFNLDVNCFATIEFMDSESKFGDTLYIDTINNGKINPPSTNPTSSKNGYEFSQWLYNNSPWNFENNVTCDMILYSSFKPIEYIITYILNGGTVTGNPTTYTIETDDFTLKYPTKDKHNFIGWSGWNLTTVTKDVVIKKGTTGNIELTANYERIYIFAKPSENTTNYVYNGKDQTYTLTIDSDDLEFLTISNNVQKNAGTYNVTVSLKDPSKSKWEDGSTDNLSYDFIIKPKQLTISNSNVIITNETITNNENRIEYTDDIKIDISNVSINGIESVDTLTFIYNYAIIDKSNNTFSADNITEKTCIFTDTFIIGTCNVTVTPIIIENTNYTISDNITSTFNVQYLRLYVNNNSVLDETISTNNRIWTNMSSTLANKVELYRYLTKEKYTESISKSCIGMQDGQFKYGTPSVNNGLTNKINITTEDGEMKIATNANDYIVGSTYYAYFKVENPYQIVNANNGSTDNINNYCIFKYKTVYNGSTYLTIEDALASNGSNLYTWGDLTNYGFTTFTLLREIYNNTATYNINKNIYVSFTLNSETEKDFDNGKYTNKVFSCLLIPNNITLNLNSSTIAACGAIADGSQGKTYSTQRGVIYNNGTVNVTNGKVYAYGYIKGTGAINLYGTTEAHDLLRTVNWCGGTATLTNSNIAEGVLNKEYLVVPFTEYTFHNISCITKVTSTTKYYGYFRTYLEGTLDKIKIKEDVATDVLLLGTASDSSCVFKPNSTSTNAGKTNDTNYIIKKASPSITNKTSDMKELYQIDGSNQEVGQRDFLEIYGDYTDYNLSVKIDISIASGSINTSTSLALPISYMHIKLKSGSKLSLTNSDYIFMPGTSLEIEKDAVGTIGKNVDINITTKDFAYMSNCIDKYDSKFIVNGTLNIYGNIGGFVDTTNAGGILNIDLTDTSTQSSYEIYYDLDKHRGTLYAKGDLRTSLTFARLTNFAAGEYVSQKLNGNYVWSQSNAKIEYVLNNGQPNILGSAHSVINGSVTISSAEISNPTREHYTFVNWYLDEACTKEAFPYDLFVSTKVYAKWDPNEYAITYHLDGGTSTANPTTYKYGDTVTLKNDTTKDDLVFGGWYLDTDYKNQIIQLDSTNITKNTDLYVLWYPAGTITIKINYQIDKENDILLSGDILQKESDYIVSTNTGWMPAQLGTNYNNNTSVPYWFDCWYTSSDYSTKFNSDYFIQIINDGTTEITLFAKVKHKNKVEYADTIIFELKSEQKENFSEFYLYPGQSYEFTLEGDINEEPLIDLDNKNSLARFDGFGTNINNTIYPLGEKFTITVPDNFTGNIEIKPLTAMYYKVTITKLENATCTIVAANALNTTTGSTEQLTIDSVGQYLFVKEGTIFKYSPRITENKFSLTGTSYESTYEISYYSSNATSPKSISETKTQSRKWVWIEYEYTYVDFSVVSEEILIKKS